MSKITQPEGQRLVAIVKELEKKYVKPAEEDPWKESPFAWILGKPSRQKGKIGEEIVEEWCKVNGLIVGRTGDSDADRVINGKRVEIKFSTLWEQGTYTFQQIRDQDYDYVICLGISPDEVHCWVLPKGIIRKFATPQHAGKKGTDTLWLQINPQSPQMGLNEYGGGLEKALMLIREMKLK
jgi:hypothetical protein